MKLNSSFGKLMLMEVEAYWSFPVFELVLFAALLSVLNRVASFNTSGYYELNHGFYGLGILLQILTIGVIIPRTFAGSINRGEMLVLLSYPTRRWTILLSKLFTNIIILTAVLGFGVLLNSLLLGVSFLEPAPYVLIAVIAIQVLFWSALSSFISIMIKNEAVSVFVFLLLMFGLEFNPMALSGSYTYLTQLRSNNVMYNYLTSVFYHTPSLFTYQDFMTAITFPITVSLILIVLSLIYFEKVMQFD